MAPDGPIAPKSSRWLWMAPDGHALPQMAPDSQRWLHIAPYASRMRGRQYVLFKIGFLFRVQLDLQNVVSAQLPQTAQISPDGSRSFHMFPDDHVELLSGEGHSFATQHLTTIPDCVPSRVATCPTLHCLGGRVQSVAEPRVRSSVQSSRRLPFVGLVYLI